MGGHARADPSPCDRRRRPPVGGALGSGQRAAWPASSRTVSPLVAQHPRSAHLPWPDRAGHRRARTSTPRARPIGWRATAGADEIHDIAAGVGWLRAAGYRHVAILGWSMGGTAVLRHAGLGGDADAWSVSARPGSGGSAAPGRCASSTGCSRAAPAGLQRGPAAHPGDVRGLDDARPRHRPRWPASSPAFPLIVAWRG